MGHFNHSSRFVAKILAGVAAVACMFATSAVHANYVSEVLADNPFVYLRMEETSVSHTDPASNSGSGVDANYSRTGGVGGSFADVSSPFSGVGIGKQFNRTSEVSGAGIRTDQGAAFGSLSEFTFEFLLRPEDYTQTFQALYATDGFGPGAIHLNINSGNLELAVSGSGVHQTIDIQSLLGLNEWGHVAVTYDTDGANKTVAFYLDGELVQSTVTVGAQAGNFDAGAYITSWEGNKRYLQGSLDEYAIYGTALSGADIQQHYSALFAPEPSALLLTLMGVAGMAVRRRIRDRR